MMTFESRKNEVMSAMDGSRYCDFSASVRQNAISDKIRDYARGRALDMDKDEVSALAETTDGYLMRFYPSLPLKEIEIALDWEMLAGDAIRITPRAMLKGVEKYIASDERRAAFAQARRERGEDRSRPLTESEVRLADFDALREQLATAWEGYLLGGSLEPYRPNRGETSKDGWKGEALDALRISQRHIYAGCYAWLKTYGVVRDDDETRRRESVCLRNARKEGVNAAGIYAEALMLEWTFKEAAETSRDLGADIGRAAGLTTEIVRMNTPLRHLQTN